MRSGESSAGVDLEVYRTTIVDPFTHEAISRRHPINSIKRGYYALVQAPAVPSFPSLWRLGSMPVVNATAAGSSTTSGSPPGQPS